jgi:hypothetical protein
MISIGMGNVLYTKTVDDKAEGNVSSDVSEEAGGG